MSSNMQSGYEPVPLKSRQENGDCDSKAARKKLKKEKKEKMAKDTTVSSRKQEMKEQRYKYISIIKRGSQMERGSRNESPEKRASVTRMRVVKMLVVVVALFGILWAPYRILVVYNFSNTNKQYFNMWFLFFCRICIYINSAVNPILYNFMSVKFRNAFASLYRCGQQNQRELYQVIHKLKIPCCKIILGIRSSEHDWCLTMFCCIEVHVHDHNLVFGR
ncbi:uncharacterized protein [Amphiura filiformis]|uniref:uncharacterized protein n=1 Tax=Amphiura filiformis TaxID=82378 RepID=UPI003B217F78